MKDEWEAIEHEAKKRKAFGKEDAWKGDKWNKAVWHMKHKPYSTEEVLVDESVSAEGEEIPEKDVITS